MKQEQKQEQSSPAPVKLEISSVVLSSKSFFATAEMPAFVSIIPYTNAGNFGKPIDRPASIFHPPSV